MTFGNVLGELGELPWDVMWGVPFFVLSFFKGPMLIRLFVNEESAVVLGYLLAVPFGTTGIWMSWPVGWAIGTALSLAFYAKGVWKVKGQSVFEEADYK